jgi:hypothetical protein
MGQSLSAGTEVVKDDHQQFTKCCSIPLEMIYSTGRTIALAVPDTRGTGAVSVARTKNQHDRVAMVAKAPAAKRIA